MNVVSILVVTMISMSLSLCARDPLINHLHSQVLHTIENADNVPGLKSEEFNALKLGIAEYWNVLVETGVLEVTATDKEIRSYFVALQGIIEHVLSNELNNSVKSLVGVIHTPMPATPLCTFGSVSQELVDASIEADLLRSFTVKARATLLRDYLFKGGELYVVYPKEGMNKRNEEQRRIYKQELANHPSHFFDRPLDCASIDNDLVGAFYLFKSVEGKLFAFAIKMTQANSPQDLGNFGLWFGEMNPSPVRTRISQVLDYILKYSFQPIFESTEQKIK